MQPSIELSQFKKLHLGCGSIFLKGFLNIDYLSHLDKNTFYKAPVDNEDTLLYNYDLTQGIPSADNSLDVIYHCHFFEHLTYLDGMMFINNCYRCLVPGGIMRILVPDFGLWIDNYYNNRETFFDTYRKMFLNDKPEIYTSKGSVFMAMLHGHEHKSCYDFETLKLVLERAGFVKVRRTQFGQSDLPEIAEIESYPSARAFESLCVECNK